MGRSVVCHPHTFGHVVSLSNKLFIICYICYLKYKIKLFKISLYKMIYIRNIYFLNIFVFYCFTYQIALPNCISQLHYTKALYSLNFYLDF